MVISRLLCSQSPNVLSIVPNSELVWETGIKCFSDSAALFMKSATQQHSLMAYYLEKHKIKKITVLSIRSKKVFI